MHALCVNFSSSAEMLHLFFFFLYTHPAPQQLDGSWASSQHCFFHQQAYCTIKHFPQAQISADELISAAAAT